MGKCSQVIKFPLNCGFQFTKYFSFFRRNNEFSATTLHETDSITAFSICVNTEID